jgi:hypothetical protein
MDGMGRCQAAAARRQPLDATANIAIAGFLSRVVPMTILLSFAVATVTFVFVAAATKNSARHS